MLRSQRLHVHGLNDCQERSCVLGVAIVKEIAAVSKGAASLHDDIPSHLPHPLLARVRGDPGDRHLSALDEDVSYYPWTLSPYKSSFSCRGSLESGGRER